MRWRGLDRLTVAIETIAAGLLLTIPTLVISYAVMRTGLPMADASLSKMDAALGFDWTSFVRWVDGHPRLSHLLGSAYISFAFQLLGIPFLLGIAGYPARAYHFITGYFILCAGSCLIAAWFPAVGAYAYYSVPKDALTSINAHFGYFFLDSFNAVRNDPNFTLSLDNASGIITFPSIHAGVAMLCVWATWPVPFLRYLFLVLNAAMCVSAVTHGSHYLVDVFAGIAVAWAVIVLLALFFRPRPDSAAGDPLSLDDPAVPAALAEARSV